MAVGPDGFAVSGPDDLAHRHQSFSATPAAGSSSDRRTKIKTAKVRMLAAFVVALLVFSSSGK
jgi:hypothetical protein